MQTQDARRHHGHRGSQWLAGRWTVQRGRGAKHESPDPGFSCHRGLFMTGKTSFNTVQNAQVVENALQLRLAWIGVTTTSI